MSTGQTNSAAARMAQLLTLDEKIFHIKDLSTLWGIQNENTLYTTLKRYCGKGLLHRIYKGFYSVVPLEKIDPILLGAKALHAYSYLSTESILFREGYISRKINYYTFVSGQSKRYFIAENKYMSRQLKAEYLFNPEGLEMKGSVLQANVYRAIADLLYFNPKTSFDREPDWLKVKEMQKKMAYPLTPKRYVAS